MNTNSHELSALELCASPLLSPLVRDGSCNDELIVTRSTRISYPV